MNKKAKKYLGVAGGWQTAGAGRPREVDILVTCDDADDGDDGDAGGDDVDDGGDVDDVGDAGGDVDDCVLMTMAMMAMLFEHIQLRFLTPFEQAAGEQAMF